jgi:hypothetical protein
MEAIIIPQVEAKLKVFGGYLKFSLCRRDNKTEVQHA